MKMMMLKKAEELWISFQPKKVCLGKTAESCQSEAVSIWEAERVKSIESAAFRASKQLLKKEEQEESEKRLKLCAQQKQMQRQKEEEEEKEGNVGGAVIEVILICGSDGRDGVTACELTEQSAEGQQGRWVEDDEGKTFEERNDAKAERRCEEGFFCGLKWRDEEDCDAEENESDGVD